MQKLYIKELLQGVGGKLLCGQADGFFEDISIDSRDIKRGQFFFAISGQNFDGHNFVYDALKAGACGAVVSKDIDIKGLDDYCIIKVGDVVCALGDLAHYYRNKFKCVKIAAITGTNAKTTTKEMLFSIFLVDGEAVKNKGNFNNRIGLPLSIFLLNDKTKWAVFELGTSIFGEIEILSKMLAPNAGLITNIGMAHLQEFKNCQGVFKEKKTLFDNIAKNGFAVINLDDKFLSQVLNKTNLKEFTYSLTDKNATLHAENIYQKDSGISFDLCLKNEAVNISLGVGGEINVLNALGAAAVAFGFGFTLAQIKKGLENFKAPSMRLESKFFNGALFINDAYNANPSSMQASIKMVCASYPTKKINLVLGDMFELGEDSLMYHKQIAEFINVCGINAVYLIGTQMRRIKGLINTKVFFADDHAALVDLLRAAQFSEGDIVLFKGSRGMKLEKAWEQIFSEN